ncbi:MAG TPA: hypothetical protein VM008_00485 [Phycisphaerae bacterium]|nr:hypothetical protein [Phycisphaerae bacterium]
MAKKKKAELTTPGSSIPSPAPPAAKAGKPSSLLDTRGVYCSDYVEQLANLPDACIHLIHFDPPFNSNLNYEVFWGETNEKRSFDDPHASTQAQTISDREHTRAWH